VVVPGTGCMVPQPFCYWRELIISRLLGRNQRPVVSGFKTLTVAPEPSVDRVVGVSDLMDGRIGTHMILRGSPRDSEV
jgi:hypothetical protein